MSNPTLSNSYPELQVYFVMLNTHFLGYNSTGIPGVEGNVIWVVGPMAERFQDIYGTTSQLC
jgi:hypothetical protein